MLQAADLRVRPVAGPGGRGVGLRMRLAVFGFCAMACLGLATGCERWKPGGGEEEAGETGEEELPPAAVVVAPVGRRSIEAKVVASSTIEAEREIVVHAESTGRLTHFQLEEGDDLKEKDLIADIRHDAQSSSLQRSRRSLKKAELDYRRAQTLVERGVASQTELDDALARLDSARLDVTDSRRALKDTRILAPFTGKVTERFVSRGAYVNAGAQLVRLTDFSSLVARVYLPERYLDSIYVGQAATVIGKVAAKRRGVGKVERIAPVVDARTGTIKVTIALPEQFAASGGAKAGSSLLPGMYTEVHMTTERREQVLAVPKVAVVHEQGQPFVYVAKANEAEKRAVVTGVADREWVEIRKGVGEGELLVIAGQGGLRQGTKLRVVDSKLESLKVDVKSGDADGTAHE